MVKVFDGPTHSSIESYFGVTVTVAITGAVVVFVALKDAMFPVPLASKFIEGVSLLHVYNVVPF